MEIVLEVQSLDPLCRVLCVSILIFVEIVLEELCFFTSTVFFASFNPYFRGDSSGRYLLGFFIHFNNGFNPYFRGDSSGSFCKFLILYGT